MNAHKPIFWQYLLLALTFISGFSTGFSQSIILDNPVRAGELTLFRSIEDEHTYYYLLDKARLATHPDGTPQFSFLRYVQNKPGTTQDISQEGTGGGIVHALIELGVTDEQLKDAERELRRIDGQGKIEGPALYTQGRFALVSTFADTDGEFTTQVLGIGSAPILDGQKAAISLHLTKLGSKVLWESFKTATPDISFSFEMELEGYRLPKRAIIEADFDQLYKHKDFGLGLSTPYLGVEIQAVFDEMMRNGAIKVTQIGEDAQLNELVKTAYNKIAEMMFEPMNGSGTPSLSDITSMAGSNQSPLDKSNRMLAQNRNNYFRQQNQGRQGSGGSGNDNSSNERVEPEPADESNGEGQGEGEGQDEGQGEGEGEGDAAAVADNSESPDNPSDAETTDSNPSANNSSSAPSFAVVASFKMKEVKQTGKFRLDLNKYTSDKLNLRFDQNIGNMSGLVGDKKHFHQVNLDDPFFRQREVSTFLDGYNAADFGKYINFVTVRLQKKHAEGALTEQEIRIDRNNFNQQGNLFRMVYGWKGDNDRRKWMDYQYEVLWSFFGGKEVKQDFKSSTFSAINLKPPYERRTITLESDPEYLKDKKVRSITVSIYYGIGEEKEENVKKVTLNVYRQELSKAVEILLPENSFDYEYEIQWRITGNKVLSSGRKTSGESILFVDEVPEE